MKHLHIILLAILTIGMTACKEKQKQEVKMETYVHKKPVKVKRDTTKMTSYVESEKVTVNNAVYDYTYKFTPSTNLPIITTSANSKYYDNILSLSIKKDSVTVYNHTFTKESFKRFIPEELYPTIVLMGFNFNYNKQDLHDKFYFVASVGDPDDEEYYIPIDVTIDCNGELYLDKFIDAERESDETEMEANL